MFVSFIDFRLPDTYGIVKIGNDYHVNVKVEKVVTTDPNENRFRFFAYEGKRGLCLSKPLSVSYPSAQPLQFAIWFCWLF